eukprot:14789961-Ditylum_brightwellii.AAC.1
MAQQKSFGLKREEGWHLGPAMERYRYYTCYKPKTKAEVQADIVEFFPHQYKLLQITLFKAAAEAVTITADLIKAINNSAPQL